MKTLTLLLFSLFSLPLMLNAQTADEMLHKVTVAIEAGQHGQAVSYFRQAISLNIDRSEMFYWTSIDKSSEISSLQKGRCDVDREGMGYVGAGID